MSLKMIKRKNFFDLDDQLKVRILVQMFRDAGHDPSRWFFDLEITERDISVKELEDACKTAVEIEDFEKAALIRDAINRKKESYN